MTEGQNSTLVGEPLIKRTDASEKIRLAILLNTNFCPGNRDAGLYALDYVVSSELDEPFYTVESIERCFVVVANTPCNLNPNPNSNIFFNLYTATIRGCAPKPGQV